MEGSFSAISRTWQNLDWPLILLWCRILLLVLLAYLNKVKDLLDQQLRVAGFTQVPQQALVSFQR